MIRSRPTISILLISSIMLLLLFDSNNLAFGAYAKAPLSPSGPTVNDDSLVVEKVAEGLDFPTSMDFLGPNDILVTEKDSGKVIRIVNGT